MEHPNTIRAMANVAATYHSLGKHTESEKLGIQVLNARNKILGVQHPPPFKPGCTNIVTLLRSGQQALIDAPLIPAGFQSFLWILVPFQWNLPAKNSKYWYSGTYTRTVPRMALECMTRMDAKNCQIWQVLHIHMKNSTKIGRKIRDGAHYWWWCWGIDYMVCAHF